MDNIQARYEDMDCMPVAQNSGQGLAPVKKLMTEYSCFIKARHILIS
jgi:hypothetical protein